MCSFQAWYYAWWVLPPPFAPPALFLSWLSGMGIDQTFYLCQSNRFLEIASQDSFLLLSLEWVWTFPFVRLRLMFSWVLFFFVYLFLFHSSFFCLKISFLKSISFLIYCLKCYVLILKSFSNCCIKNKICLETIHFLGSLHLLRGVSHQAAQGFGPRAYFEWGVSYFHSHPWSIFYESQK